MLLLPCMSGDVDVKCFPSSCGLVARVRKFDDCCLCSFARPDCSWDRLVIGDKIIRSVRMKSVEELRELVVHRYYRLNATRRCIPWKSLRIHPLVVVLQCRIILPLCEGCIAADGLGFLKFICFDVFLEHCDAAVTCN